MAYTGYDPYGPAPDNSGGGLDPSLYYAISPGGRFPGDEENYREYLAAQSRGTAGGNPGYDVPDWVERFGKLGRLAGWHERNVQNGGEGQSPNQVGGYPYHFFSGPGASYGPPGGPLHGLVDQGRPGDPWDGADRPEYVPQDTKGGKKKGGGGGGGSFNLVPQPYAGLSGGGSFVDWQPTHPFSGSTGPTRFVGGQGASSPATAPVTQGAPGAAGPGRGAVGGGGGRGGRGRGLGSGKGKGGAKGGGKGGDKQGNLDPETLLEILLGPRGLRRHDPLGPGPGLRESIGGGVNTNNIDMGTPGWMRDPTAGVHNTGGMPGPTPFAPNPGDTFDSYLTRLHDAGFDSGSIGSMLGPNGFKQNDQGGWDWGWGTGPVIRGADGYQFANQGGSTPVMWDPGQLGGAGGMFRIGGDNRPSGGGGPAGGGGAGNPEKPNAADYLTGGVFNVPAY